LRSSRSWSVGEDGYRLLWYVGGYMPFMEWLGSSSSSARRPCTPPRCARSCSRRGAPEGTLCKSGEAMSALSRKSAHGR
jgi:hypothetical protein